MWHLLAQLAQLPTAACPWRNGELSCSCLWPLENPAHTIPYSGEAGFFCSEEQPLSDTAPYLFWPAAGQASPSSVYGDKTWVLLNSESEPLEKTFCNPASSVIAWLENSLSRKNSSAGKLPLLLGEVSPLLYKEAGACGMGGKNSSKAASSDKKEGERLFT